MHLKARKLIWALVLSYAWGTIPAAVISVDPSLSAGEIEQLFHNAGGGDTLLFKEGTFRGPFRLNGVRGEVNRPVVILGSGHRRTVVDGGAQPGMDQQQYAFWLSGSAWVIIENFDIRNCWTDLIRAENSSYLSVRNCSLTGGKRALFATGPQSHHFLIEGCTWEQDERVWSHEGGYTWEEIHHGIHRHYNGSLFQGYGISGVFVLRDNVIKNTFNAFRLSLINDGEMDPLACTNGEIYSNTITNTSDNVLEPEVHAKNLHFYHNRMINGHAFISITDVAGGEIYIYGNTAVSLPESVDGWTVFKISSGERALSLPLYIFNNSWLVDFDIIGSPRDIWQNNHLRHFNNAIAATASDSFGIYNLGTDNRFDYDCSSMPFPLLLTGRGMEQNGIVADPEFRDPYGGDFRLKEDSPCIDAGTAVEGLVRSYAGSAPDIGAYDNDMLVEGPPFRYMEPDAEVPFREMPRITRHRFEGQMLKLWFSTPMDPDELRYTRFMLRSAGGETGLEVDVLTEDGYCLTLTGPDVDATGKPLLLLSSWPKGTSGMAMTGWASTLPVKLAEASQQAPLDITRTIADKIIRETSFEFRMVPMGYNGGLTGFTLDGCPVQQGRTVQQGYPVQQGETWYAFAKIESGQEGPGHLGLSYSGKLALKVNGEEVFRGSSDSLIIHEYTYDRYRFQEKVDLFWKKGTNELMFRCEPGRNRGSVLMLPLDEMDAKPAFLNPVPVVEGAPGIFWILNGPWTNGKKELYEADRVLFPPDSGFRPYYPAGNGFMTWKAPEVPMLRELVLPPFNSYTRDPYADWHYANGETMLGTISLYGVTGDEKYLGFVKRYAGNVTEHMGYFRWQYETLHALRGSYYRLFRMTMLDDSGGPALPFAELQQSGEGSKDYMAILNMVFDYVVNGQERLPDGTFCRPEPEDGTVWADDLFMSVPFLLRMARIKGNRALYDEVARQVIRFNGYLCDPGSGLYFHGWYSQRQVNSPVRWGRANGWIAWATSEALLLMPRDHPEYGRIMEIFRGHMKALAGCQDPSGMWHQVLDHPETYPETSCTAMFTLAMARGVRMGWLEEKYMENALRGWAALQEKIGPDGTVSDICRGTGIGENVDFYEQRDRFDHDPRGLGAMLTAGCEIHLLTDQ